MNKDNILRETRRMEACDVMVMFVYMSVRVHVLYVMLYVWCVRGSDDKGIDCLCQLSDLIWSVDLVQKVFVRTISLCTVIMTQQGINVVQGQWSNISKLLNLLGDNLGIFILKISQLQLLNTVLDCIPASKTMTNANIS